MSNPTGLVGNIFGYLRVISLLGSDDKKQNRKWLCLCICGGHTEVITRSLKSGNTKSCGCYGRKLKNVAKLPEYPIWNQMLQRCNNTRQIRYKNYGGRGIKVCDRWLRFENFYEDMGVRPEGKSIDRVDNDGDYSPENCEWSNAKEQARNRRSNTSITFNGNTKSVIEWAEYTRQPQTTIHTRLRRGWGIHDAIYGKE